MPYHISAKKRLRRDSRVRLENHSKLSRLRTFLKKTRAAIPACDPSAVRAMVVHTQSELAKAASKGLIHRKNAARRISRLMKQTNPKSA
jgi:small subunit ribosomal protein S20